MAINIKRPTFYKISAVKEFTDRVESRKAFWNRYTKMIDEGSTIINFYGAGGVGKTALLKKLEDEIKHRNELTHKKCIYIVHNFEVSTDLMEVLKAFKFQLSEYGCTFPFFDVGIYYYSLKIGQDVTPPKAISMLEKIPWVRSMKRNLSNVSNVAGNAVPALKTMNMIFNVATDKRDNLAEVFLKTTTDFIGMSMPVMRTTTTFMSVADSLLIKYLESKGVFDDEQKEARAQLNARREERNPLALYKYLPTLFAMDVADWLLEKKNNLVIFLDNYESLISATTLQTPEQLKRDSWLRGDDGLISKLPNTLWVIAGRNKLRWNGEFAEEAEQHLIKALSIEDSNSFLIKAGIVDENLRRQLFNMTKGYPLFLNLCVDVYVEYKRQHNEVAPSIAQFGKKRQEVVSRILSCLNATNDDVAKDILEFLCVLNVWTDDMAVDIGNEVLRNFSRNTYKRVKNFSLIQADSFKNETVTLNIFHFDKTIQKILIGDCDKKLIEDTKNAVNNFFTKMFNNQRTFDAQRIFYLKLWANFVTDFAAEANNLSEQYKNIFSRQVLELTDSAYFYAAETILKMFGNKFKSFGDIDELIYTYLEIDLGRLRRAQGRYTEAYKITKSAYAKRRRLLGAENIDTIEAAHKLAISLSKLDRYNEAITLQKKVLTFRKKILGDNHPETLKALNNLAISYSCLGKYVDAWKLRKQVLTLSRELLGSEHPDTIAAMNNLALSLNDIGCHDEAIAMQEQILNMDKRIFGDHHTETLGAMTNLAISYVNLKLYDKALPLQEKILILSKELLGDDHPDTVSAMNNLAWSFTAVGRYRDAINLQKKSWLLRKKFLGDNSPETLKAINNLAISYGIRGNYRVAATLQKKVLAVRKKILGDNHPETLKALNNLAVSYRKSGRYDKAIPLQEEILNLNKKNCGYNHPETLKALTNLAISYVNLKLYDKALPLQEKILDLSKELLGDNHPDTIAAMNNLAWSLTSVGRHIDALNLIEKALPLYKKILGDEHPDTLGGIDTLIHVLNALGRNDEAIALQKNYRTQCRNSSD